MRKTTANQALTGQDASDDADILTGDEVAAWLKVKRRQLARMGVPRLAFGPKIFRYSRADVLNWLRGQKS